MISKRFGWSILLGLIILAVLVGILPTLAGRGLSGSTSARSIASPVPAVATPVPTGTAVTPSARLNIGATATADVVTFTIDGQAPGATQAILWYDTAVGHRTRRFDVGADGTLKRSVPVNIAEEGLQVVMPFDGRLDYWWAMMDGDEVLIRCSETVMLPTATRAMASAAEPPLPATFRWSEAASKHFRFRYYPGSPAERDIESIKTDAEVALARVSQVISPTGTVSITAYLVPRVFWQGGVAYDGSTLLMTYADRNYAGVGLPLYLAHEATHALAHGLVARGGDVGGLIGEGIATYAAGGHYGPEPIDDWAAVLADSDRFIPLCRLRATFFDQQHEIAYLEGASFDGYLIRTYGLDAFRDFYAHEPALTEDAVKDVDAFCTAESRRPVAGIGRTFAELEQGWLDELRALRPTEAEAARFWGQLRFFDLMRDYQTRNDPNARILPPPPTRWDPAILRAFVTPAQRRFNVLEESLFIAADKALDDGQPSEANSLMDEIATAMDTGIFTGTVGREYAGIGALLDRYARAVRLGSSENLTRVALPGAVHPAGQLLADERLELQSVDLEAQSAVARVEQRVETLDGSRTYRGLIVTLQRRQAGWRIARIEPDPARPQWDPTPSPPRTPHPERWAMFYPGMAKLYTPNEAGS